MKSRKSMKYLSIHLFTFLYISIQSENLLKERCYSEPYIHTFVICVIYGIVFNFINFIWNHVKNGRFISFIPQLSTLFMDVSCPLKMIQPFSLIEKSVLKIIFKIQSDKQILYVMKYDQLYELIHSNDPYSTLKPFSAF